MSPSSSLLVLALVLLSVFNLVVYGKGWDSGGVCPYPCNQPPPPSGYPLYGAAPPPPQQQPQVKCPPVPVECCRQPPPPPPYPYGIPPPYLYGIPPPYPYGTVPTVAAYISSVIPISTVMLVLSLAVILF